MVRGRIARICRASDPDSCLPSVSGASKNERDTARHTATRARARRKRWRIRRARSIRFSDAEWEAVEQAADGRGMNAAEFVRHAALGVANGRYSAEQGALTPQYTDLIERIFRSTHILVTLRRDELIRDGRGEELDELVNSTRELQKSLLDKPQT